MIIYKRLICKRDFNKRTILGNIYFEKKYIIKTNSEKLNVTWFTKKKGTSWGIFFNTII